MGAALSRWFCSRDVQQSLREDLDQLFDRVDDLAHQVSLFASAHESACETRKSLVNRIENNAKSLTKVDTIADQIADLKSQVRSLQDAQREHVARTGALNTRIDVNASRSQINYRNVGLLENKFKERMDKMQADIDAINTLTKQEHDAMLIRRKSILKK
jgi:gas vesicle protein